MKLFLYLVIDYRFLFGIIAFFLSKKNARDFMYCEEIEI